MSNVAGGGAKRQEANELMYIGTGAQDIEIELAQNLDGADDDDVWAKYN